MIRLRLVVKQMGAVVKGKVSARKQSVKKRKGVEERHLDAVKSISKLQHLEVRVFMSRHMVALTTSAMVSTWLASWPITDIQLSMTCRAPTHAF